MKNLFPITQEILNLAKHLGITDRKAYQHFLNKEMHIKGIRVHQGYGLVLIDSRGRERVRGFGMNFRGALKDLLENLI